MSILFEAWRRARGADSRLAETLGAPPSAVAPRRPSLVPWVLCFVLAAIAVGLAVYLWRTHTPSPAVSAETSVTRSPPAPSVAVKPQAQATTVAQSGMAASPLPATHTPTVVNAMPAGGAASRAAPQTNVAAVAPQPLATVSPQTMSVSSAPDDVRQALPQFTVTVHVWNEDPSARFVMVGGHVYRAGDQIAPGVQLVAITQDGEVVDFRGYRLALPGN